MVQGGTPHTMEYHCNEFLALYCGSFDTGGYEMQVSELRPEGGWENFTDFSDCISMALCCGLETCMLVPTDQRVGWICESN